MSRFYYGSGLDRRILIGRTILQVQHLKEDDDHPERLVVQTDAGPFTFLVEGDCCSHTWIESIDDPDALLGVVRTIEDLPMPEATWDADEMEKTQYYGLKITTDKGRAVIDYRNASNGYYGGDMLLVQGEEIPR